VADRRGPRTNEGAQRTGGQLLIGRSHRATSESGHERGRIGADRLAPPGNERGRERGGRERGHARGARPDGLVGPNWLFFFGISNGFSILFSLGFSIQIQTKFQIQTNSNMCTNSKNILSSA
jgi:hypothetical protein